ncbi:pilus assembly PilX family protein [Verminephrobacter eiseniae]|uniref:pilus assembly PilX family protein n=1 Tax=Verminephrobacter eiseniae TaxID=364317 RepID=UPI002238E41B|nr:PilX N-terminal domain-containing pilus assembly protein [Verminephrobacter eiseniae]
MKPVASARSAARAQERGVALVVVMLFLVAITGIGIWTARQSMLAESMARNQMDQEIARQAAESALRDAERDIDSASLGELLQKASCQRNTSVSMTYGLNPMDFNEGCVRGLCYKTDESYAISNWQTANDENRDAAEPWWPKSKGGRWVADDDPEGTLKPGRDPINNNHCDDFIGGVPFGTYTGAPPIRGVAKQPEYLIEIFKRKNVRRNSVETSVTSTSESANQWATMYRITARGFGYSTRTQVVLQAVFFP